MNDNKLIAEFMGLPIVEHDGMWYNPEDTNMKFNYDTSWDWLMPVVEKIEKLEVGDVKWTSVYFNIQREYDKAVKFIKKYNNGDARTS